MDFLSISGIIIGCLLLLAYILYGLIKKKTLHLAHASIIFLSSNGFIAGIRLILFTFDPKLTTLIKSKDIQNSHILLGGIALCWVSILAIIDITEKYLQEKPKNKIKPKGENGT